MWAPDLRVQTSAARTHSQNSSQMQNHNPCAPKRARSASDQTGTTGQPQNVLDSDSGLSCGDSSPRPSPHERHSVADAVHQNPGILDFSMKTANCDKPGDNINVSLPLKVEDTNMVPMNVPDSSVTGPLGVITDQIGNGFAGLQPASSTPNVHTLSISDMTSNTTSALPSSLHPLLATLGLAAGIRPNHLALTTLLAQHAGGNLGGNQLPHCHGVPQPQVALLQAIAQAQMQNGQGAKLAGNGDDGQLSQNQNLMIGKAIAAQNNVNLGQPTSRSQKCESKSTQKHGQYVRPFKAYNPHDPLSALQVPSALTTTCPTATSPDSQGLSAGHRQNSDSPISPQEAGISSTSQQANGTGYETGMNFGSLPICRPLALGSGGEMNTSGIKSEEGDSAASPPSANVPNPATTPVSKRAPSAGMSRVGRSSLPEHAKDAAYWERRRKNNEAAKRSRDVRRQKEDEIAVRAALLERENLRLRVELAQLKAETNRLRSLVPMQ